MQIASWMRFLRSMARVQPYDEGGMRRVRTRAFTIVEVLVVVGIIGVLVGIAVPSLRSFRMESKNAGCLSNLRQQFTALEAYRNTLRGQVLPMCEFLPVATDDGPQGGLPLLLADYMDPASAVWYCPADGDPSNRLVGTSYNYLPGLLRYTPEIQLQVVQTLLALPPSTSDEERARVRNELEARLVTNFILNDEQRLFPLLLDSQDRHPGTRVPRNGVYIDGSAMPLRSEGDTQAED
jgi:prepilin-type N-terminal cleavage/methylation domain-containing protein